MGFCFRFHHVSSFCDHRSSAGDPIDQELLDRLTEHALRADRDLGVPEEEEYGWSGGRHVLDGQFQL